MTPPTNIPTPRTDKLDADIMVDLLSIQQQGGKLSDMVGHALGNLYKHARQLERELTQLTLAYQKAVADGLELKRQRDEWKEDAERLANVTEQLKGVIQNIFLPIVNSEKKVVLWLPEQMQWSKATSDTDEALAAHNKLMEQMNKSLAEHPD